MASLSEIDTLKKTLREEVTFFCGKGGADWKLPARDTLWEMKEQGWKAVLFGGTLRSLLWSRVYRKRPGRPRDIDVVVKGVEAEELREGFQHVVRETRFGGLKVQRDHWQFDVWPLHRTWMFLNDDTLKSSFEDLPYTTAFNLEAVAVEVWPESPGLPRLVFSGNDQFFSGIADRVLELNRLENPFPELTVVRGLLLAQSLEFRVGNKLLELIATVGPTISTKQMEEIQIKHYGCIREEGDILSSVIDFARDRVEMNLPQEISALPSFRQPRLFTNAELGQPRMRVHAWPS